MRLRLRSLRSRLFVAALIWLVIAIPLGGIALSLSFRTVLANNFDERLETMLLVLIGSSEQAPDGTITLARPLADPRFNQVYSGWYWMVQHGDQLLRSRSTWDLTLQPRRSAVSGTPALRDERDPLGNSLRFAEQTVQLPGASGTTTFAVAGDHGELQQEIQHFDRLLWFSLLALALGLIAAVAAQVTVGLRPLRRMAIDVADVRSGRKQRLNEVGLHEIDTLVSQVNTLIDQERQQLERARANAGDLAHSLKTPLAVLRSSLTHHDAEHREQLDAIQRTIERQLARAASAGPRKGKLTPIDDVVASLVAGMRKIHAERNLSIQANTHGEQVAVDREDLEEMLGNVLDNACKWASRRVHIDVSTHDSMVQTCIADDGPGMTDAQTLLATQRGRRFDSTVEGSGLGLAIVDDLATLYGGSLELSRSDWGGTRAVLRLPTA